MTKEVITNYPEKTSSPKLVKEAERKDNLISFLPGSLEYYIAMP